MDYQQQYQSKLTTPDEAVKVIDSGMWVDYGFGPCTVNALDHALARRAATLYDVKLRGGILTRRIAVADVADVASHFSWNTWHASGIERTFFKDGWAYYAPIRYSELPSYYRQNIEPVDVAMLQVAPMDAHGWFNFSTTVSHMRAVCDSAKHIIVEVNEHLPVCLGGFENAVHISQVSAIVHGDNPPMETLGGGGEPSPVDIAVADLVLPEIPQNACLQLGIGSMPNTIGQRIAQSDLKELGIHSEMYVDAFVDMALAGKITNSHKPFDRGRQVYTFAAGSQKLYDYLHQNPACMGAPVDYVNDVARISKIDNFISINGAVDVDLFGQVSSESTGVQHISGAGGQQDFVLGAYLSKGGKSFICCSSSYLDRTTNTLKSRIRPTLLEGTVTTATRTNLHWVVTEYGKFNAKGKTTWERAEGLIGIAHPQFQQELIDQAHAMHIWRRSNRR